MVEDHHVRRVELAKTTHEGAVRRLQDTDAAHRSALAEVAAATERVEEAAQAMEHASLQLEETREEAASEDAAPDIDDHVAEAEAALHEAVAAHAAALEMARTAVDAAHAAGVARKHAERQLGAAALSHEKAVSGHAGVQETRRRLAAAEEDREPVPPFLPHASDESWERVVHAAFRETLAEVGGGERDPPYLNPSELPAYMARVFNPDAQPVTDAQQAEFERRLAVFRRANGFHVDGQRLFMGYLSRGGPLRFLKQTTDAVHALSETHDEL